MSPGSAKRTRTLRDSCHGDCDRKQRPALYSSKGEKKEQERQISGQKQVKVQSDCEFIKGNMHEATHQHLERKCVGITFYLLMCTDS